MIPTIAREVYDVSGAGDTVIATLAAGMTSGLSLPEAAKLSNLAAGIVVGKRGTQPIGLAELKVAVAMNGTDGISSGLNKVTTLDSARLQVKAWRASGDSIVFTNGCFDLLHPGYVHMLHRAKELSPDYLSVFSLGPTSASRKRAARGTL